MLNIKNLTVTLGERELVREINLSVKPGARHLLRGANGSGKTTLVQTIIGNSDYTVKSGEIIFNNENINDLSTDERAKLGIFIGLQNVPEIPGLSVMTFLKHSYMALNGDVPMGEFIKKLKYAQTRLDIPDSWLGRSMNVGFSGGERKRLMFLHLMLVSPKLAILDEPDSGADKNAQQKFAEIINEMTNTTFLIISHLDVFFTPTETTTIGS